MSEHWRQRPEAGGRFALWLIRSIALYGGRHFARLCLYPITLYFYLRRTSERASSRAFLQRVNGRRPGAMQIMRHLHCFASTILDRVFFLARGERGFDIEIDGLKMLDEYLDQGRGLMLVGSHHGSFEALRVLSTRRSGVPLRVVLNKAQTPIMTAMLEELAPEIGKRVIDGARDPASVVLALGEAADQGQMIALLADRGRPDEAMRRVPFMGSMAPFPVGPWTLAAVLKMPVVLCFGIYQGGNRYKLMFESFADPVQLPREHREVALQAVMARYAERLQHYVRMSPYNWFNFYDFWDENDSADPVGPDDAGTDADTRVDAGVGV